MNTEWTKAQVITMVKTYPHLTAMEIARRSGWTVWAAEDLLKEMGA